MQVQRSGDGDRRVGGSSSMKTPKSRLRSRKFVSNVRVNWLSTSDGRWLSVIMSGLGLSRISESCSSAAVFAHPPANENPTTAAERRQAATVERELMRGTP